MDNELSNINSWREVYEKDEAALDKTKRTQFSCKLYISNYTTHLCQYKRPAQFYKYAFDLEKSDVALRVLFHILALWVAIFR